MIPLGAIGQLTDEVEPANDAPAVSNGEWYAVQVKRFEEQRVVHHLAMKPIPTFLPLVEAVRRRGRGLGTRLEPLFPGYLFVRIQPIDLDPSYWYTVRWTPGVRRILGTEETPVPVPCEVIRAIQEKVREFGFVRPGGRFSAGARVRIRSGPLAGLEAVFNRPMSKDGRVQVLLELLGGVGRAEVDELDLESA
jgi:transcriptional antiterminator RfaH